MMKPTVVLWHGAPYESLSSILARGIIYIRPNPEVMISNATKLIESKLGVRLGYVNDLIRGRILEATEKGGIVYVSGNKEYAKANALAGLEWFRMVLHRAVYQKYKPKYDELYNLSRKSLKCENKMTELDEKQIKALEAGNLSEYDRLREQQRKVMQEWSQITRKAHEIRKELENLEDRIERMFFSKKAVVFKIVMPMDVLKSLLADNYSRDLISKVEKGIITIEDIEELHLKEVPRQYIVSYEIIEKK